MTYPLQLLLFGICLYAVLATLAMTMAWFPADMAGDWVSDDVSFVSHFESRIERAAAR